MMAFTFIKEICYAYKMANNYKKTSCNNKQNADGQIYIIWTSTENGAHVYKLHRHFNLFSSAVARFSFSGKLPTNI